MTKVFTFLSYVEASSVVFITNAIFGGLKNLELLLSFTLKSFGNVVFLRLTWKDGMQSFPGGMVDSTDMAPNKEN